MSETSTISRNAAYLLARVSRHGPLRCQTDKTEAGIRRGGLRFWLEESTEKVNPLAAQELIKSASVCPLRDGFLDDASQSYVVADHR